MISTVSNNRNNPISTVMTCYNTLRHQIRARCYWIPKGRKITARKGAEKASTEKQFLKEDLKKGDAFKAGAPNSPGGIWEIRGGSGAGGGRCGGNTGPGLDCGDSDQRANMESPNL